MNILLRPTCIVALLLCMFYTCAALKVRNRGTESARWFSQPICECSSCVYSRDKKHQETASDMIEGTESELSRDRIVSCEQEEDEPNKSEDDEVETVTTSGLLKERGAGTETVRGFSQPICECSSCVYSRDKDLQETASDVIEGTESELSRDQFVSCEHEEDEPNTSEDGEGNEGQIETVTIGGCSELTDESQMMVTREAPDEEEAIFTGQILEKNTVATLDGIRTRWEETERCERTLGDEEAMSGHFSEENIVTDAGKIGMVDEIYDADGDTQTTESEEEEDDEEEEEEATKIRDLLESSEVTEGGHIKEQNEGIVVDGIADNDKNHSKEEHEEDGEEEEEEEATVTGHASEQNIGIGADDVYARTEIGIKDSNVDYDDTQSSKESATMIMSVLGQNDIAKIDEIRVSSEASVRDNLSQEDGNQCVDPEEEDPLNAGYYSLEMDVTEAEDMQGRDDIVWGNNVNICEMSEREESAMLDHLSEQSIVTPIGEMECPKIRGVRRDKSAITHKPDQNDVTEKCGSKTQTQKLAEDNEENEIDEQNESTTYEEEQDEKSMVGEAQNKNEVNEGKKIHDYKEAAVVDGLDQEDTNVQDLEEEDHNGATEENEIDKDNEDDHLVKEGAKRNNKTNIVHKLTVLPPQHHATTLYKMSPHGKDDILFKEPQRRKISPHHHTIGIPKNTVGQRETTIKSDTLENIESSLVFTGEVHDPFQQHKGVTFMSIPEWAATLDGLVMGTPQCRIPETATWLQGGNVESVYNAGTDRYGKKLVLKETKQWLLKNNIVGGDSSRSKQNEKVAIFSVQRVNQEHCDYATSRIDLAQKAAEKLHELMSSEGIIGLVMPSKGDNTSVHGTHEFAHQRDCLIHEADKLVEAANKLPDSDDSHIKQSERLTKFAEKLKTEAKKLTREADKLEHERDKLTSIKGKLKRTGNEEKLIHEGVLSLEDYGENMSHDGHNLYLEYDTDPSVREDYSDKILYGRDISLEDNNNDKSGLEQNRLIAKGDWERSEDVLDVIRKLQSALKILLDRQNPRRYRRGRPASADRALLTILRGAVGRLQGLRKIES